MPDEEDYRLPRTILSEALSSTPRLTPEEIKRWQETIIENKHYAAIGRAAVSWAFFESIVDGWSLNIAGIHMRPGLCFTAQIYGIGRKLETFISLARLRQLPSTLVVKLEDFYRGAKGAGGKRDRIVHDMWSFDHPSTPERLEITAGKILRVEPIPTTVEELREFDQLIIELRHIPP
jgi:hypothetical protein